MAGVKFFLLSIPEAKTNYQKSNGNPRAIIGKGSYYIRYKCGECQKTHSVHVKIRKHKGGYYTFQNTLSSVKIKVKKPELDRPSLLLGCFKLLDALGEKYVPESVRLVKA